MQLGLAAVHRGAMLLQAIAIAIAYTAVATMP